jgi:hypothetical protein
MLKIHIIFELLNLAFFIFKLALVEKYRDLFFTDIQKDCKGYDFGDGYNNVGIFDVFTGLGLVHLIINDICRLLIFNCNLL